MDFYEVKFVILTAIKKGFASQGTCLQVRELGCAPRWITVVVSGQIFSVISWSKTSLIEAMVVSQCKYYVPKKELSCEVQTKLTLKRVVVVGKVGNNLIALLFGVWADTY